MVSVFSVPFFAQLFAWCIADADAERLNINGGTRSGGTGSGSGGAGMSVGAGAEVGDGIMEMDLAESLKLPDLDQDDKHHKDEHKTLIGDGSWAFFDDDARSMGVGDLDDDGAGGSINSPFSEAVSHAASHGGGWIGGTGESHLEVPFYTAAFFFFLAAASALCVLKKFPNLGRGELKALR